MAVSLERTVEVGKDSEDKKWRDVMAGLKRGPHGVENGEALCVVRRGVT